MTSGGGAPVTAAALRARAAASTSPGVERGVGVLLGAEEQAAAALVAALEAAGGLGHGLAATALVHAARRGLDAAAAVADLAEGRPLPASWSDYELRAAASEAREDVRTALRPPGGEGVVVAGGPDAAAVVATAVRKGAGAAIACGAAAAHREDGVGLLRALVDAAFVGRLARAAGWPLEGRAATPETATLQTLLDEAGHAPLPTGPEAGLDEVVARSPSYLDLP